MQKEHKEKVDTAFFAAKEAENRANKWWYGAHVSVDSAEEERVRAVRYSATALPCKQDPEVPISPILYMFYSADPLEIAEQEDGL
jgi:hypothetical protein